MPAQIWSPDLGPGLPTRPLEAGSAEPVTRRRGEHESFAARADIRLEMGFDHRDQVRRYRDIADAGRRLWLVDDVALTTRTTPRPKCKMPACDRCHCDAVRSCLTERPRDPQGVSGSSRSIARRSHAPKITAAPDLRIRRSGAVSCSWAVLGSNQRPLPCQGSALPLRQPPNCVGKPRWRRDLNPCRRLCRPLPRLSATPP